MRRGRGRVGGWGHSPSEDGSLDGAQVVLAELVAEVGGESAVSGSLRPWPVSTQTTDSGTSWHPRPSAGHERARPATEAAEAGFAGDPFAGGEPAVSVEDLLVADRRDPAPQTAVNASIASSQRAGLPILIAELAVNGVGMCDIVEIRTFTARHGVNAAYRH